MLIMDNKHERLKMNMKYSKIHASKCLNYFKLIIQINMLNLIFNMAWIDLNIKVYNRDDISPGLTAQSSLKFHLYYTLRLHSNESHHLLLTWFTLLQYFIIKKFKSKNTLNLIIELYIVCNGSDLIDCMSQYETYSTNKWLINGKVFSSSEIKIILEFWA